MYPYTARTPIPPRPTLSACGIAFPCRRNLNRGRLRLPPKRGERRPRQPRAVSGTQWAGRQAGRQGRTDTESRFPPPSPSGPALSHARLSFLLLLLPHFHRGHQSVAPCSIACCCCCCCPTQRSRKGTAEGKEKELPKKSGRRGQASMTVAYL